MPIDREWPTSWTAAVGREVGRIRKERGMTADDLAKKCLELGSPIGRSVLANFENGRREGLTLHELWTLAAALDVPAIALAFPPSEFIEVLPGKKATSHEAAEKFTGEEAERTTPGRLLDSLLPQSDVEALVNVIERARNSAT